jgi:hypothetical protein
MAGTVFTEWLNANSSRNYPIIENLSREDVLGAFIIPNDLIVALQVNFSRDYVNGSFFIKEITSSSSSCSIGIGYVTNGSTASELISIVTIDYNNHSPYQYYSFVGQGEHFPIVGYICISSFEELKSAGFGKFEFSPSTTAIEPNCLFVSIPALKSVEIYSGSSLVHVATDVLRLKAGENIRLTYEGGDEKAIRIDAINGENVKTPDECANNPFVRPRCIQTINGIGPDTNGNFTIFGSECIGIDPEQYGISIHDLCSQSCCGCDDLEELVFALDTLKAREDEFKTMMDIVQQQQAELIAKLASNII